MEGNNYDHSGECEVIVGGDKGVSPAILAHEGHHAATWLLRDPNWRDWAPQWHNIRFQQEETKSWIIEMIVNKGIALAESHNYSLSNTVRGIANLDPI